MEDWQDIRTRHRAHGESIKSISRATGFSKNTIRKYLRSDVEPRQQHTSTRASILAVFADEIRELMQDTPKITAARVVAVLRERHDIPIRIQQRAARKFIEKYRVQLAPKEAFVRLVYAPGSQMQIDFKDVFLRIGGDAIKHHLFTARLSYSGAIFAHVFRSEDTPSLLEGIVLACAHFGGSARECLFDNAKTAVKRVLRGRRRDVASDYRAVCGSFGMQMHFAAPAKGNEKGGVESAHGFVEDNFFRPSRDGDDLASVNEELRLFCLQSTNKRQAIVDQERACLLPLPNPLPNTARSIAVKINKFAEVTHATNRYSVPTAFAHRNGILHVHSRHVMIFVDGEKIAEHQRSFLRHDAVLDPLHYIDLLAKKHRAVERAEVFTCGRFPDELKRLLRVYVDADRDSAGKQFMRVMNLLNYYQVNELIRAVDSACHRGTSDPAAIELLLQQGSSAYRHPEPLDFARDVQIYSTDLSQYSASFLQEHFL